MQERQPSPIIFHQCLFGYDDGHRLLASSIKLSNEAHASLLLLSDLVPGLKINEVGSYWTGLPIRDLKYYALMRTWSAPEISRPGCVWTHVILVSFTDIARLTDLGVLRYLSTRPILSQGYESFSNPINMDLEELASFSPSEEGLVKSNYVLPLIRAVYDNQSPNLEAKAGEFDEAIFAFWSQQWPRLRRSFSFRTAASRLEITYPGVRFDIRLIVSSEYQQGATPEQLNSMSQWEIDAVQDICNDTSKKFRQFLWRYGSDLNRGRERFKLLADLYDESRIKELRGYHLERIFSLIANNIPEPLDSLTLKKDIVSCGYSKFSLLPATDVIDTLTFFFSYPVMEAALPSPPLQICGDIQKNWKTRQEEILNFSLNAARLNTKLSDEALHKLALILEPSFFLTRCKIFPELMNRLIVFNPNLLLSNEVVDIPQSELIVLIGLAVETQPDIIDKLLSYLLRMNNEIVAKELMRRSSINVVKAVVEWLLRTANEYDASLPLAWCRELERNADILINSGIVDNVNSTRFLSRIAKLLGYDSLGTMKVGPLPWISALKKVNDDVIGSDRQMFLTLLLVLAIQHPVSGAELLFERAYKSVHRDIWDDKFSIEGLSLLVKYLPEIGWYKSWDNCKRLRNAIITAYNIGNLDPTSFYKLTLDDKALREHAKKSKEGQLLLYKASVEMVNLTARV